MSDLLHKSVRIAFEAHEGQSDKQGEPYIFHVMRVALACEGEARIVALLHDVVEDGDGWTLNRLAVHGMPDWVCDAVRAITRRSWLGAELDTYAEYIERVSLNPLAVRVKLADLRDNLRPERIASLPPERAASLSKRYHSAYARLSGVYMMPADVVEAERNNGSTP